MCLTACNVSHGDGLAPARWRLRLEKRRLDLDLVVVCTHGAGCGLECAGACPVGAISRGAADAVVVDRDACTACGACNDACPYHVIWYDDEGKAGKCDLCGGDPHCAKYCLLQAIDHREATPKDFERMRGGGGDSGDSGGSGGSGGIGGAGL